MRKSTNSSIKTSKNRPDEFIHAIKEFAQEFGYVITASHGTKREKSYSTGVFPVIRKFLFFRKKRKVITIKFRLIRLDKKNTNHVKKSTSTAITIKSKS